MELSEKDLNLLKGLLKKQRYYCDYTKEKRVIIMQEYNPINLTSEGLVMLREAIEYYTETSDQDNNAYYLLLRKIKSEIEDIKLHKEEEKILELEDKLSAELSLLKSTGNKISKRETRIKKEDLEIVEDISKRVKQTIIELRELDPDNIRIADL